MRNAHVRYVKNLFTNIQRQQNIYMNTNISRDFQICISIPWIRSHERWYEIKPVGDFKPAWKQVLLGTTLIGEVSLETNDVKSYYTMLTEQTSIFYVYLRHSDFTKISVKLHFVKTLTTWISLKLLQFLNLKKSCFVFCRVFQRY